MRVKKTNARLYYPISMLLQIKVNDKTGMSLFYFTYQHPVNPYTTDSMFTGKTSCLFLLLHTVIQFLTSVLNLASPAYSGEEASEKGQRIELSRHLSVLCVREICLDLFQLMRATAPALLSPGPY